MNIPTSPVERRRVVYETILPDLDLRPFIGGEFVDSLRGNVLPVIDPMTWKELVSIPSASLADVDAAVSSARVAFDKEGWQEAHPRTRAKYLYRLADLIERDLFQLALLESADTGKLYRGVLAWDIPNAAEVYRYYAGWADKLGGMVLPSPPGVEILTRREPIGVCAAIIPLDKIAFTGSVATAQDILVASLARLPRVTFELGDKTPLVICQDADLDVAIPACVNAAFGVSGQNCCAGSRILVQQTIFDQVLSRMVRLSQVRLLGDPLADETEQGPQIDLAHVERIDQFVKDAVAAGGMCVVGGSPQGNNGQFYAPTLFTGLSNSMSINQEEVFGPVATLIPFSDIDEAIHLANDREFGLAAALWTRSGRTSEYFVRKVRAGTCRINCSGHFGPVAPWGGRKLSGTGRELGFEGIAQFLENKTVIRVY